MRHPVVLQTSNSVFSGSWGIFWHPWGPWGRIHIEDIKVLVFVFKFFWVVVPPITFFKVVKSNSFVCFLEEIEDINTTFEINWSLKSNIFSDVTKCNLFNYDNVKLVSLQNWQPEMSGHYATITDTHRSYSYIYMHISWDLLTKSNNNKNLTEIWISFFYLIKNQYNLKAVYKHSCDT